MVNAGDTAWVLISSALVMLMTPGLAFFYGGMVRKKNVLSILMQCFIVLCLLSVQWVVYGYSISFAPNAGFGLPKNNPSAPLEFTALEANKPVARAPHIPPMQCTPNASKASS